LRYHVEGIDVTSMAFSVDLIASHDSGGGGSEDLLVGKVTNLLQLVIFQVPEEGGVGFGLATE